MKTLLLPAMFLGVMALASGPGALVAQPPPPAPCNTAEGCRNDEDTQVCTDPEHSETYDTWEDCHVVEGFCQLSGICEESFAYVDLPADRRVTVAGTYVPAWTPSFTPGGEPFTSCTGLVIAAVDAISQRPEAIVLRSSTSTGID